MGYDPFTLTQWSDEMTNLWRLNQRTGYWEHVRACSADNADQWITIFRRDDPGGVYKLAVRKPRD